MIRHDWAQKQSVDTSDAAERALVAACLSDPSLLMYCEAVKPGDFRSTGRGVLLGAIREAYLARWRGDPVSLAARLDASGARCPNEHPGWASTLGAVMDWDFCAMSDEVEEYARIVKDASKSRQTAAILRGV